MQQFLYLSDIRSGSKSLAVTVVFAIIISGIEAAMAQNVPLSGAANDFVQAMRAEPNNLTMRRQLAQALFKEQRFAEAAEQLKLLLNSGTQESCDQYWLGESYYHLGRFSDAVSAFRQAIKLDPKMDEAKVRMVEAYLASQNMSEARMACAEALATATNPYAKQHLVSMSKITNKIGPLFPQLRLNDMVEVPNNGKR